MEEKITEAQFRVISDLAYEHEMRLKKIMEKLARLEREMEDANALLWADNPRKGYQQPLSDVLKDIRNDLRKSIDELLKLAKRNEERIAKLELEKEKGKARDISVWAMGIIFFIAIVLQLVAGLGG